MYSEAELNVLNIYCTGEIRPQQEADHHGEQSPQSLDSGGGESGARGSGAFMGGKHLIRE